MIKGQRIKLASPLRSLQCPGSYHLHITHRPSCCLQQLTRTFLFTVSCTGDLCDVQTENLYVLGFIFFQILWPNSRGTAGCNLM